MGKPGAGQIRGLWWIYSQAEADFQACRDERGTGQFSGTTNKEVESALDYLRRFLRDAETP